MMSPLRFLLVLGGICALLAAPAAGQSLLPPPFGLNWGDPPAKLLDWAERHALDVTVRLPGDAPDLRIVRVEQPGKRLPDSQATAVEARFRLGRLFEVTVHYHDATARTATIKARYLELKTALGIEYGELKISRRDPALRQDNFSSESITHHVEPAPGLFLLLTFSTVEDLLREKSTAKFSLIYRNENLYRQLEPPTSRPGDGVTGK